MSSSDASTTQDMNLLIWGSLPCQPVRALIMTYKIAQGETRHEQSNQQRPAALYGPAILPHPQGDAIARQRRNDRQQRDAHRKTPDASAWNKGCARRSDTRPFRNSSPKRLAIIKMVVPLSVSQSGCKPTKGSVDRNAAMMNSSNGSSSQVRRTRSEGDAVDHRSGVAKAA